MSVFVTVGSTSFDELIVAINSPRVHVALMNLGYNKMIVQYGNGRVEPCLPSEEAILVALAELGSEQQSTPEIRLSLIAFRYKPTLSGEFAHADLVISHGGAGTCMESLTPPGQRRLIVVINKCLMSNHQAELARTLSLERHAIITQAEELPFLLNHGVSQLDFNMTKKRDLSELIKILGPTLPPIETGFRPFVRGEPKLLIRFLDYCVRFDV